MYNIFTKLKKTFTNVFKNKCINVYLKKYSQIYIFMNTLLNLNCMYIKQQYILKYVQHFCDVKL